MKVFNITDVETKTLKQRGLVLHTVCVGKQLIAPGESADLPDDEVQYKLDGIQELVDWGVLALGQPPKGYAEAPRAKTAEDKADASKEEKPAKLSAPPKSIKKDG